MKESIKIESSTWSNWSGGMAGVGGNSYEIKLSVPADENITATSLIIDGESVEISGQNTNDGILTVSATENKSNRDETIPMNSRKPNFRTENPNSATLVLKSECCEFTYELTQFEKSRSKNNQ
ncbi:MAG: hypothetical protein JXR10_16600 [Cyclobacteriaceae bacterium]